MNNAIKYTGMAIGAGMLILAAIVVYFFMSVYYSLFIAPNIEYYRGRFLLTATVEVDGEIKTGQSVYEVSYNSRKRGPNRQGIGARPINGARGALPSIDLGKYGILMFTFRSGGFPYIPGDLGRTKPPKCYPSSALSFPIDVMVPKTEGYGFRDYLDAMIDKEGVFYGGKTTLPVYLIKKSYAEKELKYFEFCNAGLAINQNIKPISISIEHTDLPLLVKNPYPEKLDWTRSWAIDF